MSRHQTYVIRLPDADAAREQIIRGIKELVEKHGGEITAASREDAMTILDMIEQYDDFADYIADEARAKAKALHATAE